MKKDTEFFDFFKPAELQSRYNEDFSCLNSFQPTTITNMVSKTFRLVVSIFSMHSISKELFMIHSVVYIMNLYVAYLDVKKDQEYWEPFFRLKEEANCVMSETLANIRMIKTFSTEEKHLKKLEEVNAKMKSLNRKYQGLSKLNFCTMIESLVQVIELWFAGQKIIQNEFNLGSLSTFQMLSKDVSNIFPSLCANFTDINRNLIKAQRIFEIMEYQHKLDSTNSIIYKEIDGTIEFKNV